MNDIQATNLDQKRETADALLRHLQAQQGGRGVGIRGEPSGFMHSTRSPHEDTVLPMAKAPALAIENQKEIPIHVLNDLDDLIRDWGGPAAFLGDDGLFRALTAALVQRVLDAELTHHLGYDRGQAPPEEQQNRRNGTTPKKVRTKHGPIQVEVPRDRQGTFTPQIVPKHQRSFPGFDEQIVSLYSRGMSDRDIRAHLHEIYGTHVSPDLISRATEAVIEEMHAWQRRPLDAVYPIVYLDALVVKIRDTGVVQNKAIYLAVGVTVDGTKEVLGMWVQSTEGAKFWLGILTELKQRGVQDILALCADGLTGLPQAVEAAFPRTIFQTCIVHMIRSSMRLVPWQERKKLCAKLREVYTAPNAQAAGLALDAFEAEYGRRYPRIAPAWRARWEELTPFLSFPAEIRRAIYTTNAIEALNRQLRKVLKTKGHLPTEDAALKLVYLNVLKAHRWSHAPPYWRTAQQQFEIYFEGRLPQGGVS